MKLSKYTTNTTIMNIKSYRRVVINRFIDFLVKETLRIRTHKIKKLFENYFIQMKQSLLRPQIYTKLFSKMSLIEIKPTYIQQTWNQNLLISNLFNINQYIKTS